MTHLEVLTPQTGAQPQQSELSTEAYSIFARIAKRMLLNFPSVRRWDDTFDITNSAYLRFERKLGDIRTRSEKELYCLAAANIRWLLIDRIRSYQGPYGISTNQDTLAGKPTEFLENVVDASECSQAISSSEWSEFHLAVEELPKQARDTFSIIWYGGLTQTEAARLLGVDVSTVKRRWRKARLLIAEKCTYFGLV